MAIWRRLKLKSVTWMSLLAFCLLSLSNAWAEEGATDHWPQEIETSKGVVVIYQPQPEKFEGNKVSCLAAVAIELKNAKEPIFGAIWFEARLDTDRDERTATITDVEVTRVRFPEQTEEKAKKLAALIELEMPKMNIPISLDRLTASLELVETRAKGAKKIKTDPPKIIFMAEPAVLIPLDGEPRTQEVKGSNLKRVINTPFTILHDTSRKTYYLHADKDSWYTASEIKGEWAIAKTVPSEVAALAPKEKKEEPASGEQASKKEKEKPGPPPKIIVSTEPTELISSTGKPEFKPLADTDLLYMSNTDSDVLMEIKTQEYYILLSGRWFVSKKMEGPWVYVLGENLPAGFAKISEESEMGTVLYAVPGTDLAKEAVLDAQIPQTATVDRKKATLTVQYDGEPKFETITGIELIYAVNTATPVIRAEGKYYACDEAIWFVSGSSKGPWQVATSIPDVIYTIPPESPIYNVTYVRIYDATPEVVYIGYTPGYTHTYVYGTTIVYGTGYWYTGWHGHYYYPWPCTWGYHVRWNPWVGWGFGLSYSYGPYRFAIGLGGWYRGGWWGPGLYRGYRHGFRHGARAGYRAGYRAGHRDSGHRNGGLRNGGRNNAYNSKNNKARTRPKSAGGGQGKANTRASKNRANNVYADRNGNVNRKTDKGWEQRSNKGWESRDKGSQSRNQQDRQRQAQNQQQRSKSSQSQQQRNRSSQSQQQRNRSSQSQQLNRSHQSRQQGNKRSNSYNRSRSSSSRGRSGGGRSGGGRSGGGRGGGRR
jgi:hypothetical protein